MREKVIAPEFGILFEEVAKEIVRDLPEAFKISQDASFWHVASLAALGIDLHHEAGTFSRVANALGWKEEQRQIVAKQQRAEYNQAARVKGIAFSIIFGVIFILVMHLGQMSGNFYGNLDFIGILGGIMVIVFFSWVTIKSTQ